MSNFFQGKMFAKISELDETVQFDSLDEFVLVNDRITQKITGQNLTESIVAIGNLASKAYVDAVVDGAPALLDTLNELAAALDNDENFATTITALIGTKLASNDFNSYFDTALTSKTTSDVAEDTNLYYTQARFDSALAAKTTSDVAEGSNLYWTQARFDAALGSKSTSDTTEGSNLYYTQARFDSAFAAKTTTALAEGDNLYWTQARFDAALATKTTSDLAEGTNLYFTEQRVLDIISAQPTNRLANGSFEVTLNTTGTLTLPADPTSDSHAATKGYVDNQITDVVAGQGFATLDYVEDAISAAIVTARTEISTEITTAIDIAELDGGAF
jgi:hypothetical protein